MESALYGIFTLVGEVSEISLVRCAHSFDFRYFTNSCENPVRARFPWSNLYFQHEKRIFVSPVPSINSGIAKRPCNILFIM